MSNVFNLENLTIGDGLLLFTDGSSWTGDRSGGWAWVAIDCNDVEAHGMGGTSDTTNNRMEMTAWVKGLSAIYNAHGPCDIVVLSDSEYVGKGAMDPSRKRKANIDIWLDLDEMIRLHTFVGWQHVRGHTGNQWNELCDTLASEARKAYNYPAT